jgi:hypothetical protein
MVDEYGKDDYSEGIYGGGLERVVDTRIFEYLPEVFPRDKNRVLDRYVDAHDTEFDGFDQAISYVEISHQVENAEGRDLDRIGKLFGPLGARGTRDRQEYRDFLENIINSFNARGTVGGLKFAIASAANTTPDQVVISEDFSANEYEISITDPQSNFVSTAINDLAALADPSGVKLAAPPVLIITGDELVLDSNESTVIETTAGLGSGTLSMEGGETLQ